MLKALQDREVPLLHSMFVICLKTPGPTMAQDFPLLLSMFVRREKGLGDEGLSATLKVKAWSDVVEFGVSPVLDSTSFRS